MGGVLRGDDKAVSKMDIKIQDNGRTRGHCIGSYDSMTVVSVPPETKWAWEMTQSLCNEQRRASGKNVSKSDFNCDGQNHFLVIVSRGFRLSHKKPRLRVYPVSNKSLFRYARKGLHIHS